jgi:hypothetical protein
MKDLFSKEANEAIAEAFAWLERRKLYVPEPIIPVRIYRQGMPFSNEDQRILRSMAESAVWIEKGGEAIREASRYQAGGDVVGRTSWLGMPEWAKGFGYDREQIKAIVEKAITGNKLAAKQTVLIQAMLDTMAEADATVIPF